MYQGVTYDLSDFGKNELAEAGKLLLAYGEGRGNGGCLDRFGNGVKIGFNFNSGYVWLEDEDCNCLMYNEETQELYQFYFLSYNGNEGSAIDLYEEFNDGDIDPEDYEQLAYILEDEDMDEEAEQVRKAIEEAIK